MYNELKAIKYQDSPYLLKCYGAFFEDSSVRLVLEYMDCGSVESMIAVLNELCPQDNVTRIPELVISRIICQVLNGIHYLHTTLQ